MAVRHASCFDWTAEAHDAGHGGGHDGADGDRGGRGGGPLAPGGAPLSDVRATPPLTTGRQAPPREGAARHFPASLGPASRESLPARPHALRTPRRSTPR